MLTSRETEREKTAVILDLDRNIVRLLLVHV